MNTRQLYWARFKSEMPKALKSLAILTGAISTATGSMSVSLLAFDKAAKAAAILGIISGITGGIALGCKFSTTDPTLSKEVPTP